MKYKLQSINLLKSKQNRSILFNYFRAYVTLLLILCIATGFIYGIMSHSLKEQIVKVNNILIQNIINSLEKEFTLLYDIVNQINSNFRIEKYMNTHHNHLSPAMNYNAYEIIKDLATYTRGNNFIEELYIFFNNGSIISSTYKTENSFFFKYLDKHHFNIPYAVNRYKHKEILCMNDNTGNKQLFYVNSLPVGDKMLQKAIIIIQINLEYIRSLVDSNLFTDKAKIIITDAEHDSILEQTTYNSKISEKDLVVTSVKSEVLQWEVISIIPKIEYEAKLITVKNIIIFILLLAIFSGIIFALYFSYRNYQPIAKLMDILNKEREETNGIRINEKIIDDIFLHIENNIFKTINENRDLKEKIDKQEELLANSVIEKLVKNVISSEKEIKELIDVTNINTRSSKFFVCSVKLDFWDNQKIDYPVIISQLKELLEGEQRGYVFYINEFNITILVEIVNDAEFNIPEFGKKIIQIFDMNNVSSTVGIGDCYNSIEEINRSYKEALLALNVSPKNKDRVITYNTIKDVSSAKTKYYYPVDVEKEIINNTKAGNIKKVEKLLEDVYNENFKVIQLSGQISRILIYNIISTVLKIMNDLMIDLTKFEDANILLKLYHTETVNDIFSSLITTYRIICDIVNQNKKSNNRLLFEKIENFLKDNFDNSEISLEYIALKFNLSTGYLSRFFKEHSGVNLIDYLHKLRIEKAKEIFSESDNILVQDVALKVGYSNSGALIRAFNKYEGITPGEYKSMC